MTGPGVSSLDPPEPVVTQQENVGFPSHCTLLCANMRHAVFYVQEAHENLAAVDEWLGHGDLHRTKAEAVALRSQLLKVPIRYWQHRRELEYDAYLVSCHCLSHESSWYVLTYALGRINRRIAMELRRCFEYA